MANKVPPYILPEFGIKDWTEAVPVIVKLDNALPKPKSIINFMFCLNYNPKISLLKFTITFCSPIFKLSRKHFISLSFTLVTLQLLVPILTITSVLLFPNKVPFIVIIDGFEKFDGNTFVTVGIEFDEYVNTQNAWQTAWIPFTIIVKLTSEEFELRYCGFVMNEILESVIVAL